MNCPNCMNELAGKSICPSCLVDTVLFERTTKISNKLYNDGLNKAKENKLTSAISVLNKSISINKNNCDARNLLGLIYLEVGHIGDALKQWVISSSILKQNNLATDYIIRIQNDSDNIEKINDCIDMYNNALSAVKLKNQDLAIIQLKKVIDINPNFIDALNLITFCYLMQDNKNNAKKYVELVLSKDVDNVIALSYYKEAFGTSKPVNITNNQIHYQKPVYKAELKPQQKVIGQKRLLGITDVVSFVIGVTTTALVMYLVVIPLKFDNLTNQIKSITTEYDDKESSYLKTIEENNKSIQAYKVENEKFAERINEVDEKEKIEQKINKITEIQQMALTNDRFEVAEEIYSQDFTGVPEEDNERLERVKTDVYTYVSRTLYNDAISIFNRQEYVEAKLKFEEALKFSLPNSSVMPDVIYYLGLIAEIDAEFEEAKEYFNTLVTEYPRHAQVNRAKDKLDKLQ